MRASAGLRRCASSGAIPRFPRVGVACIVFQENAIPFARSEQQRLDVSKVLLVKRGRPPSQGLWSTPGGSVQYRETLVQAGIREVREETGLETVAPEQWMLTTTETITPSSKEHAGFHYVLIHIALLAVRADRASLTPIPGDDAADARWASLEEVYASPKTHVTGLGDILATACERFGER